MKIGDILAMTKKVPLEEIAKQYLTIGKTAARQALKNAGCYCKKGTRGWHHDNLPQVAERSIYEFIETRKAKPMLDNQTAIKALMARADAQIKAEAAETDKEEYYQLDAIDRILFREQLERDSKTYKGFYWDADIIEFINTVEEKDQSELMNEIVRSVLVKKGFL
ncbi:hypothetical protein L2D08_12640 [Domibacillus sp. PGB-M46]|uniref:hypothetical protein n=1 Tax=Domibacillus sp. PGB-M46 TaxID=2910255 RepID=UPI001F57451F|nr:hypothetical protein [Domibacillus sp. PGB-M46]MCI2255214.1 hypothetical protein [Domibacillus sp. PGB-M46]